MKRFLSVLLCLVLLAPAVFASGGDGSVEFFDCAGDRTMMELKLCWEAYGYPDSVGYATRLGFTATSDDYLRVADTEYWEIGVVGPREGLEALLGAELSNRCSVRFTQAEYSRGELQRVYLKVLKDYCRDIACGSIGIARDRVCLYASPLLINVYQKDVERKYGGAVTVLPTNVAHNSMQDYDENGNAVSKDWEPVTFDIFALCAAAALAVILLVFGVIAVVRGLTRLRERRKATEEPSESGKTAQKKRRLCPAFLITLAAWLLAAGLAAGGIAVFARPSYGECLERYALPYDGSSRLISLPRFYSLHLRCNKTDVTADRERDAERLLGQLFGDCGYVVNTSEVRADAMAEQTAFSEAAAALGMSLEDYFVMTTGETPSAISFYNRAFGRARTRLLVGAIAEREKLRLSDEELAGTDGSDEAAYELLRGKVYDLILKKARVYR